MPRENFVALEAAVVAHSQANVWNSAKHEWDVIAVREDPASSGECVCGQKDLRWLFTIKNRRNAALLEPIGSKCVNHFDQDHLDEDVNILPQLLAIRAAIAEGRPVTLTSDYFSRALLTYLEDNGVFTPDQWNTVEGHEDYWFLTDMFNKRKKETITAGQRYKIRAILHRKVLPFIAADQRLW